MIPNKERYRYAILLVFILLGFSQAEYYNRDTARTRQLKGVVLMELPGTRHLHCAVACLQNLDCVRWSVDRSGLCRLWAARYNGQDQRQPNEEVYTLRTPAQFRRHSCENTAFWWTYSDGAQKSQQIQACKALFAASYPAAPRTQADMDLLNQFAQDVLPYMQSGIGLWKNGTDYAFMDFEDQAITIPLSWWSSHWDPLQMPPTDTTVISPSGLGFTDYTGRGRQICQTDMLY